MAAVMSNSSHITTTNLQGQNWKAPPWSSTSASSAMQYFNFPLGGPSFPKWGSIFLHEGFWSVGSRQGNLFKLLNKSGSNSAPQREGKHSI